MTTPRTIARPPAVGGSVPQLIFGDLWEYDPAPETADPKLKARYDLFIGGKFVAPKSGKYFESVNPATEEVLAEIALASPSDVDAAYHAAQKAFTPWSKLPGAERGKYLYRIARLIQDRAREFAVAETMDGGKPIKESRDFDVPMAAAHFFYHAGWADKLEYAMPGVTVVPLGVVGQVIPWNFPLLMLAWKIAPALAMGNTVVLKPAETTSITALKFAELLVEAELPPGVVNFVCGAGETGVAVVGHLIAAKIAFTGSTDVGKLIIDSSPAPTRSSRWSWEERPPTSCLTILPSIRPSKASSTESSSIRDTSAAREADCWCRNRLPRCSCRN